MRNTLLAVLLSLGVAVSLWGQKAKSQKEYDALKAIEGAYDPDSQISAVHALLTTFKNTEFKEWANFMAMNAYSKKNDFENMLLYGEQTLAINPENAEVLTALAYAIPTRTKQFDLDKEAKLSKAEDFARRALRLIPTAEKPNPEVPDEQWLTVKKNLMSQAHDSLGLVAFMRRDFVAAEQAFQQSLQVASEQSALTFYHYANALKHSGQTDKALENAEKSIAAGGVPTGTRDLAKVLKAEIIKARAREMFKIKSKPKSAPAAAPAVNAAPVAEEAEDKEDDEEEAEEDDEADEEEDDDEADEAEEDDEA